MADLSQVYEDTRASLRDFVAGLDPEDVDRSVPATPGWTVRDILAHLTGDAACIVVGDFPREFFAAFGDVAGITPLNRWTAGQISERAGRSVDELFREWDAASGSLQPLLRGENPWPDGIPDFADRVVVTDLGVHQQDIYGAFGISRDRDGVPVKVGLSGYIATTDMRLKSDGVGAIRFVAADKEWTAGGTEPIATLRATRFELFRALSGRRSMDQLRAYDWDGDPEPFLKYFYPYGVRADALVE
jgi:uncharacterized protein (TIGR03083 family)